MVFYRKWRPQTLAEVAGQEHVTQTLRHALESDRVAHAYLFCGPRGTGKTSTGRILAKAVNCLNNGKGEPCNTCEMCRAITQGRALDVIEIDAASNRGIDEVRELREKVNFAPSTARYKVYIIDEVHMLTEPAANALLKTLEEPPSHAIFILATTEPHKILPTIFSRCQRFDFRRLSLSAIVSKLSYICQKEGISAEPASLKLIARSTSGSLRDAENLLEQLLTCYGPSPSLSQVQEMLGVVPDRRVEELAQTIAHKDLPASLSTLNRVVNDGVDLAQFHRQLLQYFRGLLLIKSGAEETLDFTAEEREEMKELAGVCPLEELLRMVKLLGQIDLRFHNYSSLPLEVAIAEGTLPPPEQRHPRQEPERESIAGLKRVPSPPMERGPLHPIATTPRETMRESPPTSSPAATTPETPRAKEPGQPTPVPPPTLWQKNPDLTYIQSHWKQFVNTLRGMGSNHDLDARLRSACEPVRIEGDTLVLAFRWSSHYEKLNDGKYLHLVEQKLSEIFGTPSKVQCILQPNASQVAKEDPRVKYLQGMGGRIVNVEEK